MERIDYNIIFVILLVLLVVTGSYFIVKQKVKLEEVCFENGCFQVEIASKQIDRVNGLMYREGLVEGRGMLFVFEREGNYSFWMRNMNFPIDIIWINSSLNVVYFVENAQPCLESECESYSNIQPAKYVLEINSGKIEELEIEVGDKVMLDYR